jgi:hypothetical protein
VASGAAPSREHSAVARPALVGVTSNSSWALLLCPRQQKEKTSLFSLDRFTLQFISPRHAPLFQKALYPIISHHFIRMLKRMAPYVDLWEGSTTV